MATDDVTDGCRTPYGRTPAAQRPLVDEEGQRKRQRGLQRHDEHDVEGCCGSTCRSHARRCPCR